MTRLYEIGKQLGALSADFLDLMLVQSVEFSGQRKIQHLDNYGLICLCTGSTCSPVAVGVVLAALVHRIFVNNQAHVVVSTFDRGEACRVSHPSSINPSSHAQMHPQLSRQQKGVNNMVEVTGHMFCQLSAADGKPLV